MYPISEKQIDFILDDIRRNGIELEDIQQNILDHVCCIIESELEENGDFEQFYATTISTFYRSSLAEIEEETKALLINKNYYKMRKTMFVSGTISASILMLGILFKFMHWPGASICLVVGITLFSLVFLPLIFTVRVKEKQHLKDKLVLATGSLIAILISMAIMFKIQHWPGANMMGLLSLSIMGLVYIPLYFFSGIKNPDSKANTIVTSILMVAGCGLFLALARSPQSSQLMNINNTSAYMRTEMILATEIKQVGTTLKENNAQTTIIVKGARVMETANALKGEILLWATGTKALKDDFVKQHQVIEEGWVRLFFENNSDAESKLSDLKNSVEEYNTEVSNLKNTSLQVLPVNAINFNTGEEKTVSALTQLAQLQMMVVQNKREVVSN